MKQPDRTQIPQPTEPRPFHFPDFDRFYLDNGLELLVVKRNNLPLISVSLCLKSSALADPEGREGATNLLTELLSEGTQNRNSEEIAEELEFIAANFSAHVDWNGIHLDINTLSQHLPKAMDIFSDILLHPTFPEKELERIRSEILSDRMRVVDNAAKLNAEFFIRFLYEKHRYGITVDGWEESIKNVTLQDIHTIYNTHFVPENGVLIFVGDINVDMAKQISEQYFLKWKKAPLPPAPQFNFKQPEKQQVYLIHKEGSAQTELRMGHLGLERKNPDYYNVMLLNEILGGYFLSRINMNLRERNGFTYGAGSSFSYRKGIGPFHISTAVQSEHTAAAVREVLKEIDLIRNEAVREQELEDARGQMIGLFPIAFETADQVALGLSNIVLSGLKDDYYNTFRDYLSKVTREDILRAAQTYLHPDKMVIVVTGDRTIIEEGLRKQFDVRVFDVYGKPLE